MTTFNGFTVHVRTYMHHQLFLYIHRFLLNRNSEPPFSAWLRNELDEVAARINKRIERLTHLAVETAEELQVVNYGIGGHYEPHFDFARVSCRH